MSCYEERWNRPPSRPHTPHAKSSHFIGPARIGNRSALHRWRSRAVPRAGCAPAQILCRASEDVAIQAPVPTRLIEGGRSAEAMDVLPRRDLAGQGSGDALTVENIEFDGANKKRVEMCDIKAGWTRRLALLMVLSRVVAQLRGSKPLATRALNSAVASKRLAAAIGGFRFRVGLRTLNANLGHANDRRDDGPLSASGEGPRRRYSSQDDRLCRRAADGCGAAIRMRLQRQSG